MKKIINLSLVLFLFLQSCAPYLLTIMPEPKKGEIIISSEMKEFSKKNKNPSIVLRVPYVANSVSEGEQKILTRYNSIYNQIEKNLLKEGFIVRDRGLLNNLLSSGQANYEEIQKKIQTDILLEILSIDFAIDNFSKDKFLFYRKSNSSGQTRFNFNSSFIELNPKIAKLECKLTIVEKGLNGAMLTLYLTACEDGGCDFYISWDFLSVWTKNNTQPRKSIFWQLDYDDDGLESTISYFTNNISNILKGNTGMIGLHYDIDSLTNILQITEVTKNYPAEIGGLQVKDFITKIDSQSTFGKSLKEISNMFAGSDGAPINLTIKRGDAIIEKTIIRTSRY